MATVWRIEYGIGPTTIEFDQLEAEQLLTRQHCAADVQEYKNGLARVYTGPAVWNTYRLTFNINAPGTITRFNSLKALRVTFKFYPRYHTAPATFVYARVVSDTSRRYMAGHAAITPLEIELVETTS